MFKSYRVGSLFGIPIKLDITLLIVLPVFAFLIGSQISLIVEALDELILGQAIDPEPLADGNMPWLLGLAAAIGLFIGVLAHELGHSLVALRYEYEISSITLWLLGGVAQFTEQPREWAHEFWIAIAGPAVSVLVGVVCYGLVLVLPSGAEAALFVFGYLAILNIALAVFNMIPAFPLDGGRVLRALLTRRTRSFTDATQRAVRIGKYFAIAMGILGLFFNLWLIAIAFFIYLAGSAEGRHTAIAAVFKDVSVTEVMTDRSQFVTVGTDLPLADFLDVMMERRHTGYPVVENGEIVGVITLEDFKGVPPELRSSRTVGDVMSPDLKTIDNDASGMDAFREISQQSVGRLLVTDADGTIIGMITRTDLVRAFELLQQQRMNPNRELTQLPTDR